MFKNNAKSFPIIICVVFILILGLDIGANIGVVLASSATSKNGEQVTLRAVLTDLDSQCCASALLAPLAKHRKHLADNSLCLMTACQLPYIEILMSVRTWWPLINRASTDHAPKSFDRIQVNTTEVEVDELIPRSGRVSNAAFTFKQANGPIKRIH